MLKLQSASLLWKDLHISPHELRLNTLRCGQSFRWKQLNENWYERAWCNVERLLTHTLLYLGCLSWMASWWCWKRLVSVGWGQSVHWTHADTQNTTATTILYGYDQVLNPGAVTDIRDYFQLDRVSLRDCYQRWSKIDPNFAKKSANFQGIRMLRQDPWENLISFICSSNNNISRISQMVGFRNTACIVVCVQIRLYDKFR